MKYSLSLSRYFFEIWANNFFFFIKVYWDKLGYIYCVELKYFWSYIKRKICKLICIFQQNYVEGVANKAKQEDYQADFQQFFFHKTTRYLTFLRLLCVLRVDKWMHWQKSAYKIGSYIRWFIKAQPPDEHQSINAKTIISRMPLLKI